MCGRYTLRVPAAEIGRLFGLPEEQTALLAQRLHPRFNIAPTQQVPAVRRRRENGREAAWLRWGLVPSRARDPSPGGRMIHARAETAAEKPVFRSAFRRRRCLVPADGWYEWEKHGRERLPWFFHLRSAELFAIAGLWERWRPAEGGGGSLETLALLTTDAPPRAAAIHPRMPVLLPEEAWETWLDPETPPAAVQEWLRPWPAEDLEALPVRRTVNSARRDDPSCLEPDPEREAPWACGG